MIKDNSIVTMNYTLKDGEGNVLDSSNGQPFDFIQGQHQIIPGLEKAITAMNVGDSANVKVVAEEGYGGYRDDLKFSVSTEQFGNQVPEPGMTIQVTADNGQPFLAQIASVEGSMVTLDANHPLAGKDLYFDVEITGVRDATSEELAHGHAHGPDGHHHH